MITLADDHEHQRLREIDLEVSRLKNDYTNVMPIYLALCRKKAALEKNIKTLEDEKIDLLQGQMIIPF